MRREFEREKRAVTGLILRLTAGSENDRILLANPPFSL